MTNDRAQACLLFFPVSNREVRGRRSPGSAHVCTRVYDYKRCTHAVPCSLHCGKTGRRDPHPDEFHRRGDIMQAEWGWISPPLCSCEVWDTCMFGRRTYEPQAVRAGCRSTGQSGSGSNHCESQFPDPVVVKTKQLCRPYYLA